jgi:iron complex outermembrane receptor protein
MKIQTKLTRHLLMAGTCSALALGAAPNLARATTTDAKSNVVGEVVVTATRRAQSAQKIAIPIDSYNAKQLEQSGVKSVVDLQFLSPGLKVADVSGLARISLRGVGTNGLSQTAEAGVASYEDGVFLGNAYYPSRAYFDLQRVEVLRGPQGTLYGRNATGGAVNIITAAPTPIFEGGGNITYGNYNLIEAEGHISGPIAGDDLMGRLSFRTQNHDGYTPNTDGKAQDNADNASVRARLTYKPTDRFSIDLAADYSHDAGVTAITAQRADPSKPLLYELLGGYLATGRRISQDTDAKSNITTAGVRATIVRDFGPASLTSISAYRRVDSTSLSDFDFTTLPLASSPASLGSSQISEDLYATSAPGSRFEWTIGTSFFHEHTDLAVSLLSTIGNLTLRSPSLSTNAYAGYAEGAYHLDSHWTLTVGGRYTYEWKEFDESDLYAGGFSPTAPAPFALKLGPLHDSWTRFTPHASLSYSPNDSAMVYATYSQGFKAGGYNSLSTQSLAFAPEDSTNYEIGVKSETFDHRLRLNASAFYMDYRNLQVQQREVIPPSPLAVLVITNAAKAQIKGVEFDFLARPVSPLTIDGNLAYLDSEYTHYDAINTLVAGNPSVSAAGERLNAAPRWSANLGVQYAVRTSDTTTLTLRGEYSYQSRTYNDPTNAVALSQVPYSWFNARATLASTSKYHWSVAAWIKNIGNVQAYAIRATGPVDAAGGQAILSYYLPPRTFGLTLGYDF